MLLLQLAGCKKFLDEKPNKKLVVPSALSDLRAILDYSPWLLLDASGDEISADNYYLSQADYNAMPLQGQRLIYTWAPDNIYDVNDNDWSREYRKVFLCNTVLEALKNIPATAATQQEWNNLKGEALMIRGKCILQLAQIFTLAFDSSTAASTPGLPLRLNDDFNEQSVRSNLFDTYSQIINDLKESVPLLPLSPAHVTNPSRPAAYAYLARTYLAMGNHAKAGMYADSSLMLKNTLINYNTLSTTATFPFAQFNQEQLFHGVTGPRHLANTRAKVDTLLYSQYDAKDCRKTIFFRINSNGTIAFKGSYAGNSGSLFSGIATDEMYLTSAESYARAGNIEKALARLDSLLIKRYKTGQFTPSVAATPDEALSKILVERRKELVFRFIRWMDIKRLNKQGAGIILKRQINNQEVVLPPNDLRYALPIPETIIRISGITQNPR